MPSTACPIAGCDFVTADVPDAAERIALLTIHTTTYRPRLLNLKKSVVQRLPVAVQAKTGNILSKDGQTIKLPQIYMAVI